VGLQVESLVYVARCLATILLLPVLAGAHVTVLREQIGNFAVDLNVPPEGIRAGERLELFLRVSNSAALGEAAPSGVSCERVSSQIAMPSMPGMPVITPDLHWLGYPGSYGLKTTFPHAGFYRVSVGFVASPAAQLLSVTYLVEVLDENMNASALPKPYWLKIDHEPARLNAGKPVRLSLSVWSREMGRAVTEFEIFHEKKMHLIVVSEDLGFFFHEHPVLQPDGSFAEVFRFPSAGKWVFFADTAPRGSGEQVALGSTVVGGRPLRTRTPLPAVTSVASQDGLTLVMQPSYIAARRSMLLTFRVRDSSGNAPVDIEPWLGAPAHLILVEQDATTFVHSHPETRDGQVVNEGLLSFQVRFPKPGKYKAWIQLKRDGKLSTLPFVIEAVGEGD
jgi:hypothetical protein